MWKTDGDASSLIFILVFGQYTRFVNLGSLQGCSHTYLHLDAVYIVAKDSLFEWFLFYLFY